MTLSDSYVVPQVGDIDEVGFAGLGRDIVCTQPVDSGRWVCTLPQGHWGLFHVAHFPDGQVIAVDLPPAHMRVPAGL